MKKIRLSENWLNVVLVIFFLAVVLIPVWKWPGSLGIRGTSAQGSNKSLHKFQPYTNDPVKVFGLKVANHGFKFGEEFSGSDDWLKGVRFKVKNLSGKEVVHLEIHINFPETKLSGNEMSFRFNVGHWPGREDASTPLRLKANDEATISLEGERYDELVNFIGNRHPIAALKRADIGIGFVDFADGTAWSAGTFYSRDPGTPNKYTPINAQKAPQN